MQGVTLAPHAKWLQSLHQEKSENHGLSNSQGKIPSE